MKWYDYAATAATGGGYLAGKYALDKGFRNNVNDWYNKKNAPQVGSNPYLGNWNNLIGQLEKQSSSSYTGPSLAQNAYREAHAQGLNDVMSASRGGSAGAARAGMNQMGKMNQGFASGYSNARLQEQLAMQQQLQGALGGAGNAWFQPQAANLQATLGTQSNGQQLMQFLQQALAGAGTIAGK